MVIAGVVWGPIRVYPLPSLTLASILLLMGLPPATIPAASSGSPATGCPPWLLLLGLLLLLAASAISAALAGPAASAADGRDFLALVLVDVVGGDGSGARRVDRRVHVIGVFHHALQVRLEAPARHGRPDYLGQLAEP